MRALHVGTNPLEWDESLATQAQEYAQHLVQRRKDGEPKILVHSSAGHGENLHYGSGIGKCADAVSSWYTLFYLFIYLFIYSTLVQL